MNIAPCFLHISPSRTATATPSPSPAAAASPAATPVTAAPSAVVIAPLSAPSTSEAAGVVLLVLLDDVDDVVRHAEVFDLREGMSVALFARGRGNRRFVRCFP